jgi:hypothetical protein
MQAVAKLKPLQCVVLSVADVSAFLPNGVPGAPTWRSSPAGRVEWPLTGRSEELAAVGQSLTSLGLRAVVVTGAPGVGKIRLAREVRNRCAAREYVVH